MKHSSIITAIVSCLMFFTAFCACSSTDAGVAATGTGEVREFKVGDFDELCVANVDVTITVGAPTGVVRVEAPEKVIERMEVKCTRGELSVNYKKRNSVRDNNPKAKVFITVPSPKDIVATVGATVSVDKAMSVRGIDICTTTGASVEFPELKVSGDCDIEATTSGEVVVGKLTADELEVSATTGASVKIKGGAVRKAELDANTGADVRCAAMSATTGSASASTGGSVDCHISNLTDRIVSTGGSVDNH